MMSYSINFIMKLILVIKLVTFQLVLVLLYVTKNIKRTLCSALNKKYKILLIKLHNLEKKIMISD